MGYVWNWQKKQGKLDWFNILMDDQGDNKTLDEWVEKRWEIEGITTVDYGELYQIVANYKTGRTVFHRRLKTPGWKVAWFPTVCHCQLRKHVYWMI